MGVGEYDKGYVRKQPGVLAVNSGALVKRCDMVRASKGYDGIGSEKEEINRVFGYIIYPEKTSDLEPHYDIIIMLLAQ